MSSRRAWWQGKIAAMLALALPCLAGLGFMALFGAPTRFLVVNAGALAAALAWIAFGALPGELKARRALAVLLLAIMVLPFVIGPEINEINRWVSLGPLTLHAGMLVIPLLACIAADDRDYAPPILLAATFIALIQPDAAAAFALMLAAVGLYFAWKDWKPGVVAIIAFVAAVLASVRGELPPQPFVERILAELILRAPLVAFGLALSLVVSFFLILRAIHQPEPVRYALAGALAGFSIAALMQNYPGILIGYGAAPILGFGLALGLKPLPSSKSSEA